MKILPLVCRVLLGMLFVVFGANMVHPFMHAAMPPAGSPAGNFFAAMGPSGWLSVVGAFEVVGGLMVLAGGTVPLGLCFLCPITVNILLFHLCLMGGQGLAPGGLAVLLEILLIWFYRANFYGILTGKARPVISSPVRSAPVV